eukprot:GEZU01022590.1.p3 GENE.GEZU01022590.1~~GEZU01022590.1.p3  ORF type:complete len:119 (+),score=23.51 GEZU01022590.1:638-994(+)
MNYNFEKEAQIRKRILAEFNKRPEEFESLRAYNDYLEEIEDIIYNLVNDLDVIATNAKIEMYRKQNRENIAMNTIRKAGDRRAGEAQTRTQVCLYLNIHIVLTLAATTTLHIRVHILC